MVRIFGTLVLLIIGRREWVKTEDFFNTREVLEAILKSIDEGIHVIDNGGRTIFYNEVAGGHDGMKVEEVLGKPLLKAFPSLNQKSSTLLQVIETEQPIFDKRQSYLNLHGKMIETLNTTLPIHVENQMIGAIEIAKDYSRLKNLSERLLDLETTVKKPKISKKNVNNGAVYTFNDILTKNPDFQQIIRQGKRAAESESAVLVFGESGVGKELFVQGIHNASPRCKAPFIAQNCAALPESLLESLLFGTAKGSYTGAVERQGLFELANGGTLFLDELQSMPIELQAKLLRVLEDGLVRRIGGSKSTFVDARIITAMNTHPEKAIQEKTLRPDLFYRLNVLSYELPPLHKRPEDVVFLVTHFIRHFNIQLGRVVEGISEEVQAIFLTHHWPGNVRELKHTIEFMMNHTEGTVLQATDLPVFLKKNIERNQGIQPLRDALNQMEETYIQRALLQANGNVLQASKLLDIPRQTLQYKIQKRQK